MAQAMLRGKEPSYEKMTEENNGDELKRYLNVNLLTTMYPLNNSWTKKIIVGLNYNNETKKFEPLIQFLNTQYTHGLHITRASWSDMQNRFGEIDEYFDSSDCRRYNMPDTIQLADIDVLFSTSFGTKSIVFDKSRANGEEKSSKRRKTWPPTVVMQKRTFQGLKRTVTCVEERYFRLDRIAAAVNKCKDYIKSELTNLLDEAEFKKKDVDLRVRRALKENGVQIQDKLKKEFDASTDAVFMEHYFDIVYLELITLYYELFCYEFAIDLANRKIPDPNQPLSQVM